MQRIKHDRVDGEIKLYDKMPEQTHDYKYTTDIKGYQEAVWDFLMEHCEVLESGAIFIKFHTDGRQNFENRILSRWKYNYHREDPKAKYDLATSRRKVFEDRKAEKAERWRMAQAQRKALRKAICRVKRINAIRNFIKNIFT